MSRRSCTSVSVPWRLSPPFAGFSAFGHEGSGGAMAYADPDGELVLAYVLSRDPGEADVDAISRRGH